MTADLQAATTVDVRVVFSWREAGTIVFDQKRKLRFPELPPVSGVYRLTLTGAPNQARPQLYFGESDLLILRMDGYRTGGGKSTNFRLNRILCGHLAGGGAAGVAIATSAVVSVAGAALATLDLNAESSRLLAENAAIVAARLAGDVDLLNV